MSCVAFSVGFGNVWRFPYTAYENGGGAFLIPYLVVLFVIGKPFYYMEMALGQFTSRSCLQVWSVSPAFRGTTWSTELSKASSTSMLKISPRERQYNSNTSRN
jgi:solute carrier family 6 amino acid transporter-like protein 5/7/9/14